MPVTDVIHVPAGSGSLTPVLGSTHINKALPIDTDGAFVALEITIPQHCGPPLHNHDSDAECFYVLEGEITFDSPGGRVIGKAGDVIILPRGGIHAFSNQAEAPAKAFVVITPGLQAHSFFHEVGESSKGEIDPLKVVEIATRNGLNFVPQPYS